MTYNMTRDEAATEIIRLNAIVTSQAARIRELEGAIARCLERGVKYREIIRYHSDAPRMPDDE